MAVTYAAVGSYSAGTGSATPGLPTHSPGDLLLLWVWYGNSIGAAPSAPADWSYVGGVFGGDTAAYGLDAGPRGIALWYKVAGAAETAPTVTNGGTGTTRTFAAHIVAVTKTLDAWVPPVATGGQDSTTDTAFSVVAASNPGAQTGDALFVGLCWAPDNATGSAADFEWQGLTGVDPFFVAAVANQQGNDMRIGLYHDSGVTGTATGPPSYSATLSAAGAGVALFARVRDEAATQALTVRPARSAIRATRPTLAQLSALVVRGVRAQARAGVPRLSQLAVLTTSSVRAASRATRPTLAQATALAVRSVRATARTSNPRLGQVAALSTRSARAPTRTARPSLATLAAVVVKATRGATRATRPRLQQTTPLGAVGARAEARATTPALGQVSALLVRSTRATTTAARPLLETLTDLITRGARAATGAKRVRLSVGSVVTPPDRTLAVPAESRVLAVAAESRALSVPAESRTITA